ncbi:MAG: hypothetical protein J1F40_08245 [Prevotellaceae bacterium]|nr:hypothetical protein [Prevotellaceae bacterium]
MTVKRKNINLERSMQEMDKRIEAQRAVSPSILESLAPIEEPAKKKEVKVFDRKKERPDQKCIHFDRRTTMRINDIKNWKGAIGERTTVEDIVFDAVQEYLDKHYDEVREKYESAFA